MNALRLACEVIGAAVLLLTALALCGGLLALLTVHVERARKRRELSLCRSCGEPQQGGWCANCSPPEGLKAPCRQETRQLIERVERDRRSLYARELARRDGATASADTLEHLLGLTVEEP